MLYKKKIIKILTDFIRMCKVTFTKPSLPRWICILKFLLNTR